MLATENALPPRVHSPCKGHQKSKLRSPHPKVCTTADLHSNRTALNRLHLRENKRHSKRISAHRPSCGGGRARSRFALGVGSSGMREGKRAIPLNTHSETWRGPSPHSPAPWRVGEPGALSEAVVRDSHLHLRTPT